MSTTDEVRSAASVEPTPTPSAQPSEPKGERHRHRHRRSSWLKRIRRRFSGRIRWTTALLVVITGMVVIVVAVAALVIDSVSRVETSIGSFQRVMGSVNTRSGADLTLDDFNRLSASVGDLVDDLGTARSRLGFLQPLTRFNRELAVAIPGVDAAQQLAVAASDMLDGLQPTLFFLVSGSDTDTVVTQISSGERVVQLLRIGRGEFATAATHLANAKQLIDGLNLNGVSSNVLLDVQELGNYETQLDSINTVLLNAPDFLTSALGLAGDHNYLVLSQNNDELRPSGGYISTYGWITVRNGQVTNYGYSPTTTTSPNPPAADLAAQLNMPTWWLQYQQPIYAAWDGSWFTDFPSTARMSIWYYNTGNNPQSPVDGAISIDEEGFEDLLGVIGSVTVPGYESTPVTPANFRDVVYNIRDFGGSDEPHKRFLAALYQQIFAEWQNASFDPTKNTQLLGAMLDALQQKHIMMYFSDQQLEDAVNLLGWSGEQSTASDHDYLLVSDANMGNKSNHSIIRSITYDADIQADGSVNGHMTLSYDYSARNAANDPAVNPEYNGPADYNNLAQIYVPTGTTLTTATNTLNTPTVVNNDSNTEFVTRMFVPFDSSQNFEFTYATPPIVENLGSYKRYRLLLQKQPGTDANAVDVQILLPPNAKLISTTPDADASYNLDRPILEFRTDLSVDRWIEVIYQN